MSILLSFKLINSFNIFKQPLGDYTHSKPGLYGRFQQDINNYATLLQKITSNVFSKAIPKKRMNQ